MNPVAERIAAEIRQQGPIPFARFMELALYCPVYGYYEKEGDTAGRRGDFYTSVSVGSLFGELLAWQFADWLREGQRTEEGGQPSRGEGPLLPENHAGLKWRLVEAGAHRGELGRDLLGWLKARRPQLFNQLEYWIVEPSERRRGWQQQTLKEFSTRVHWASRLKELKPVRGIIFSNELLDAMPVHQLRWDARACNWTEWGVSLREERFVWTRLAASCFRRDLLTEVPADLAAVLPDEYTIEDCPAARDWWAEAAAVLEWGKLLAIDYGFGALERLVPERTEGTLRGYRQHRITRNVLADPGEQDLTAHVDFEQLQRVGESAGLRTEAFVSQAQFLTGIGGHIWAGDPGFGEWDPQRRRQFQTLTHPEHLGRAFSVLVQGTR